MKFLTTILLTLNIIFAQNNPYVSIGAYVGTISGTEIHYGNKIKLNFSLGYYNLLFPKNKTFVYDTKNFGSMKYITSYDKSILLNAYASWTKKTKYPITLGAGITQRWLYNFQSQWTSLNLIKKQKILKALFPYFSIRINYPLSQKYEIFLENGINIFTDKDFAFGLYLKNIRMEYLPCIGICIK